MPGLLRGVARTAVTAVSNRVSRRQANRWNQQEEAQYYEQQQQQQYYEPPPQQYAPAPAPAAAPDPIEQLQKLADLKNQGILTEAEFEAQKAKILAS
jgi:type II secretory pathway component PulL